MNTQAQLHMQDWILVPGATITTHIAPILNANIQRSFIVNACELATYDTSKDILCSDYNWDKNKVTTHAVCALNAGLV